MWQPRVSKILKRVEQNKHVKCPADITKRGKNKQKMELNVHDRKDRLDLNLIGKYIITDWHMS